MESWQRRGEAEGGSFGWLELEHESHVSGGMREEAMSIRRHSGGMLSLYCLLAAAPPTPLPVKKRAARLMAASPTPCSTAGALLQDSIKPALGWATVRPCSCGLRGPLRIGATPVFRSAGALSPRTALIEIALPNSIGFSHRAPPRRVAPPPRALTTGPLHYHPKE